jgi:hypothetical protein
VLPSAGFVFRLGCAPSSHYTHSGEGEEAVLRALLSRAGKHRQRARHRWWFTTDARLRDLARPPLPAPSRTGIEVVDARSRVVHQVSLDRLLDGRARGDYEAFCGVRLLTASLTDPGRWRCPEGAQ